MEKKYLLRVRDNDPLSWGAESEDFEAVLRTHHAAVGASFASHIAQTPSLLGLYQQLSAESRHRISVAPETYCATLNFEENKDLVAQFYSSVIRAELMREGRLQHPTHERLWTALGDFSFGPEGITAAPRLHGSIVLDRGSFTNFYRPSNHVFGAIQDTYDAEEALTIQARLEEALDFLQTYEPRAYQLVRCFAKVVMIKKDPASPSSISNASNEFLIGLLTTNNSHRSKTIVDFVDFLVHEAIHSLVYLIEKIEPIIRPGSSQRYGYLFQRNIISPWSGNKLDLHSLTHAVIVWYALSHLWKNIMQRLEPQHELALKVEEKYIRATAAFFWAPNLFAQIGPKISCLNVWSHDYIAGIAQSVRASAACQE